MKLLNNTHLKKNSSLETGMPNFLIGYRKLRNCKRYQTSIERILSNCSSTEEIANRSSSENIEREVPKFQMLTQEAISEQSRGFIPPIVRHLEELTRLVQGMTTSRHLKPYPRTELGTTSGTAMPESDRGELQFCLTVSKKFER